MDTPKGLRPSREVRRARLKQLIGELKVTPYQFATTYLRWQSPSLIYRYLNGKKLIGDDVAPSMEKAGGRPSGWLDRPSDEADQTGVDFEPWRMVITKLTPAQRHKFMAEMIRQSESNDEIAQHLRSLAPTGPFRLEVPPGGKKSRLEPVRQETPDRHGKKKR